MNGDESFNGPNVVPLRTILRKFLSLVDNYEARRNGGLDSYDSEFQELKQFSENLKADPDHVCREGERNVNRKKNRYKDILPYDFSRVILSDYGDVPGSDYINANFIKGASGSSAYIACQGPLPHTVNEFWRMVVECEVQVIVMACNEQESGKHKCENYWVEEDGVEREFGQVTVWLKKCRNVCPDFLVRTMRIRFTNSRGESEERNVCQFHYSAWPDHGVPTKVRPLLDMVRLIRDCQTSETLPVLVHCSAGCGRTGTICAIDYVWGLLRLGRLTPEFSLFTLVRDMRSQRIAMVQTKDQYILVHRAVKELFQEQLKIIDAHPYANVDENGLPLEIKRELQEPTYETLEFKPPFKSPSAFLVDSDKKKNSDYADTGSSNIVVSVSNVNTHSNVNSNNNHNPSILPLPVLPPKTKTTDVPSSSPLSSTGSGSVGASGEESRSIKINVEKSLSSRAIGSGSVRIANNNNSNSNSLSNGGHVLQSSSSSNEDRDEKENQLLKSLTSTFTVSSSDSSSTDKPSSSNGNNPKSSHSNNPLRSALLRKPSISKLKSFFEKTPKEEKDKDVKKSGSTQLSRAKSDVSTRFHAFKDFTSSFTSRTPPPPSPLTTKTIPTTTTTASSSSSSSSPKKDGSKLSSELSSKSTENTNIGILENENHKRTVESSNSKIQMLLPSKKPAIPSSKPILSIKRSKSLKVPSKLTTTTINYQNNISGLEIGGISSNSTGNKSGKDKDKEVHHYHSQVSNSVNSSSSGASGSSSGFSSTIADNPIKVCVKQVEIPKLQSVVSKSIKPEVLLATSTASMGSSSRLAKAPPSSQEYDYDIDDRSHLRSQKPMSTSSSSVFQLQQESFQPSNSLSSSPETKTNPNNGNSNSISNSNPLPSSRIHILKDNHNYANVIYGNSNSNHSAATSSSSNNNHQRSSSSSSRSQTMEDIQNFPSSRDSNEQSNQRGGGGELKFHGKLKKCDTVNPRILAASLGYTIPGHERSSILTRSQSHVWQPEKLTSSSSSHLSLQQKQQTPPPHQQQQSLPVRVFSSDNIHQPSPPPPPSFSSLSMSSNSNDRNRNSSSPSKTINMGTGSGLGIDYPVIMRKPKHTSITTNQNHRKPIRESNNDDIVDSNNAFVQATSGIESPSPVTTSALASNSSSSNYQNHVDSETGKGYHSRESSLDKSSTFNYSQHSVNSNSNGSGSGSNGKPVVRRRVPKTNPYANYPACVTGSNSNFPYKLPKSNQILNASGTGTGTGSGAEDMSTSGSSNNYSHIMSGNSSNNFGGYSNTPSNELVHTNHHQHYRKDSNSSIPILKPSYGGSIGNSSESSSNTETPRNSLPSTPTQSVDVLYPQLHRNNSNNSNPVSTFPSQNLVRQQQQQQNAINNNYESTSSGSGSSYSQNSYKSNPKSILKEQMLQQQQQQISHHIATPVPIPVNIETSEKSENLRNFHQLQPPPPPPQPPPLPPPTFSTSNNANSNPSSSSHIPKISTVRIAVGVRERRNSFRQAVWKEAPNNSNEAHDPAAAVHENPRNLIPSQKYINNSSNFNNSVATPRNNNNNSTPLSAASSSISQIPALPKIHQNYEPIWPESLSNHNYNHNQTNPFQAMPVFHPAKSNSTAKMNNSYSNSNTFPHNENSKLNSSSNSKSNSIQDQSQSSQKSLQNPAFQTKVDEIKVMLAELDAPVSGKFPNKTNTPGQGSSGAGTTTSLKQQRSLRAPSRSQYQQQGLSCFTFKKPSSYESLVDQLHQEQEQQELEDSDEYQPLINNTGTSSSSMGSTTGIIGIGPSAASIRKDFLYHPPSMRDNVESTSTSRNSNFSRGPHAQANDYVTLRQCRTVTDNHNLSTSASNQNHNNSSNNSNHIANASRQSSSSSPDFPKKFSMNSSSSGSPLGSSSNTPVPPPRSKAKRGVVGVGGGQSSHSSSKSPATNNYDRDFQTDTNNTSLSHPAWAASASYNTKMNYYPMPINTVPNANMSTSNYSELPRPHHPYEEYHDVGLGLGPGQGQIQQNPRDHHSSGDDAAGNVNNSNSITTSTSPKAIIRALGLFQAKAANVRSRFANWTEAKDRSLGNANKLVHENGNGPPLDQSNGNGNGYGKEDMEGSKGDHIMTGAGAGGSGNLGSSRSENNQLPTTISGSGHILGRSKHQYL